MSATERLFVYGSLAPGRPNHHIVEDLEGEWHAGWVRGVLHRPGWGAEGYPGLVLDPAAGRVPGFVLESHDLAGAWQRLDGFEGSDYERVTSEIEIDDGRIRAQVYVLKQRRRQRIAAYLWRRSFRKVEARLYVPE